MPMMKGAFEILSCAVVSPNEAKSIPVEIMSQPNASKAMAHKKLTKLFWNLTKPAGQKLSSESNTTCSALRDTKGSAPKMTTTISNSVNSKDPGMECDKNLRPLTSKKVSTMMAKRAKPDIRLQSLSRNLFTRRIPMRHKKRYLSF